MQNSKLIKIIVSLFYVLPFIILYVITNIFLSNLYLFDWTARNLYLWLFVLALKYFEKCKLAIVLNISNIIGLIIGEGLGSYLRQINILSITPYMSNQEIANAHTHYGVIIWFLIIIISMTIAILMEYLIKQNNNVKFK